MISLRHRRAGVSSRCIVLPLSTPGDSRVEFLSLSRHAPSSRDVGGASRDATMSARSMFLRAVCRLSTATKALTVKWEGSVGWTKRLAGAGTHSWHACPPGSPIGWAGQRSGPAESWGSQRGSGWCRPHWSAARGPVLNRGRSLVRALHS